MNRKQLIEEIRGSLAASECEIDDKGRCGMHPQCYCRDNASNIVSSIEYEIPGLASVLDGKAIIVELDDTQFVGLMPNDESENSRNLEQDPTAKLIASLKERAK